MKTNDSSTFTLFQDRDLHTVVFPSAKPARFSSEPEGEGVEVCLRGLLVACLFAAMMICGVRLDNVARTPDARPAWADARTAVAIARPVATPVAKAL